MIGKHRTVGEIINTIQDVTKVRDKIDDILNRSDDSLEFRIASSLADASEYLDGYIVALRSLKIDEA